MFDLEQNACLSSGLDKGLAISGFYVKLRFSRRLLRADVGTDF
jgi:hypothetical protein